MYNNAYKRYTFMWPFKHRRTFVDLEQSFRRILSDPPRGSGFPRPFSVRLISFNIISTAFRNLRWFRAGGPKHATGICVCAWISYTHVCNLCMYNIYIYIMYNARISNQYNDCTDGSSGTILTHTRLYTHLIY